MHLARVVESRLFAAMALVVILVTAVLIGWETYAPSPAITAGLAVCLYLFVAELALKLAAAAQTGTLGKFFRDGWNIFDLVVVIGSFLPEVGALGPILRVIRVLRVFRLVRSVPELRLIVTVLIRSVVSMKYITLLAAIIFYIYAVIGVQFFGKSLKEYATLHEALFTLFRVLTGDNWTDLRYAVADQPFAWKATAYHVSWIVVSTFLLINLIVGAVLNNYQEVQEAEKARRAAIENPGSADPAVSDRRLAELAKEMQAILKQRAAG